MKKRNLNLVTDYIADSDEPFQTEFDYNSEDEINEYFDYLMSQI